MCLAAHTTSPLTEQNLRAGKQIFRKSLSFLHAKIYIVRKEQGNLTSDAQQFWFKKGDWCREFWDIFGEAAKKNSVFWNSENKNNPKQSSDDH